LRPFCSPFSAVFCRFIVVLLIVCGRFAGLLLASSAPFAADLGHPCPLGVDALLMPQPIIAAAVSGVHANGAEESFSRMRRAKIGHHHHIAGAYLVRYARESARREDHRRVDNGTQVRAVSMLAMNAPTSVDWCGYWQRARKAA
jgi:hypothetical protein